MVTTPRDPSKKGSARDQRVAEAARFWSMCAARAAPVYDAEDSGERGESGGRGAAWIWTRSSNARLSARFDRQVFFDGGEILLRMGSSGCERTAAGISAASGRPNPSTRSSRPNPSSRSGKFSDRVPMVCRREPSVGVRVGRAAASAGAEAEAASLTISREQRVDAPSADRHADLRANETYETDDLDFFLTQ